MNNMHTLKDMNWWEKIAYTAIGWHYGCRDNLPKFLRVFIYPLGIITIPFGAAFLPHYMVHTTNMPIPKFLLSNHPWQWTLTK